MLCKYFIYASLIMMNTLSLCTIGDAVDDVISGAEKTFSDIGTTVKSISNIELTRGGIVTTIKKRLSAADQSKRMLQSGLASSYMTVNDLRSTAKELSENLDDAATMLANKITPIFKGTLKTIKEQDLITIDRIISKAQTKQEFNKVVKTTDKIFKDINFNPSNPEAFQIEVNK